MIRSDAKCWSWAWLMVHLGRFPEQAQDLLGSRIISLVSEIRICPHWNKLTLLTLTKLILESVSAETASKLKKLSIFGLRLDNIDPGLLTNAVLNLQDCRITGATLGQQEAIITGMRDSTDTNLKHLELAMINPQVTPDVLAGAVIKLESFMGSLSSPQLEAVLTSLATTQDPKLRSLDLGVDISSVAPGIVGQAFTKLERVGTELSHSLTASQLSALFTSIRQSPDLRLRELELSLKDLTLLPLEDLVGAIQRLEEAWFRRGVMTVEQLTTILTLAKEERLGRIKRIEIHSVGGMGSVSSSLIRKAKLNSKLEWDP